ncbi:LPS assembly lipoprotein LptE [Nitratireductor sp. GCM10026969]|uniref:LPS assembly lipoprotein LptE n=1 Tax=Nitratireductor sp. GCM10026969 TaxID=3252645 RepID=UPI00361C19E1
MNAILRASALAGLIVMLFSAAGCTVRPMLASQPGLAGEEKAALSAISVDPVSTRHAQEVRNHLIFLLNGGTGQPENPRYRLGLTVTTAALDAAQIQQGSESEPSAGIVTVTAQYRLIDSQTGNVVAGGQEQASASFDRPLQEFAVMRAERDAEDRAAREAAEFIRLAVAQDLVRLDTR